MDLQRITAGIRQANSYQNNELQSKLSKLMDRVCFDLESIEYDGSKPY